MNYPYLLIPISAITLFLYFLSVVLYRLSIIHKSIHRKIWNSLLLISFIVTALLGLFLTIQVNYKFYIPYLDQFMKWHVNLGITMSIIAVIHLIWHWSYYRNIFKGIHSPKNTTVSQSENRKLRLYSLPVISLGLTATITQIIMLREFLSIFSGNEIVIGLIITNWMIITGISAFLGRYSQKIKKPMTLNSLMLFLLGFFPILTVFLLNILKNVIFTPGIETGIVQIWYTSLIFILPFCFVNGYFFTFYSSLSSVYARKNKIAKLYGYEALGSITGGMLFSFLMIYIFDNFQILSILLLVNSIIALFINRFRSSTILFFIAVIIALLSFVSNINLFVKDFLFINQELVESKQTPYGNLSVTKQTENKNNVNFNLFGKFSDTKTNTDPNRAKINIYENNNLLFTNEDIISNEEKAHYIMLQHSDPKNVLIISGGIGGLISEILKYDINRIDYIEFDPYIIRLGNHYMGEIKSEKVKVHIDDPYIYLKRNQKKYDAIIINLPEPLSAQLNRFYTLEFFMLLKSGLNKNGIASFHLQSSGNYYSEEAVDLHSTLYNTLKQVFKNILIIPGENEYYLFSDSPLSSNIADLLKNKQIENKYVNEYYLDSYGMQQRSSYLYSIIDENIQINTNYKPVAYLNQFSLWISKYHNYSIIIVVFSIVILAVIILFVSRFNPLHFGMFTTGFTVASSEIIIILAFQILCGYVYHLLGIIITIFMAGMALGAISGNKIFCKTSVLNMKTIQFCFLIVTLLMLSMLYIWQYIMTDIMITYIVFLALSLMISIPGGLFFAVAVNNKKGDFYSISSGIYSIDLIGSAIGTLLITILFIPLLGILYSCLVLIFLNSVGYLISSFSFKK